MLNIVVLGGAAGGGVPQWNCNCATCKAARNDPRLADGQASIAVSADGENWFLVNASPDIRQQINDTPELHPKEGELRHSPIAGVILTNGEVDAVAGLLSLREGSPFSIWGHDRVLSLLDANSIFNVLDREKVPRRAIEIDVPFDLVLQDGTPSGLTAEAFEVPGKSAWYLETTEHGHQRDVAGDTLGLKITGPDGKSFFIIAASAGLDEKLADRLRGADLVFFDGTLWTDDEIVKAGLGPKTGQRMGHMSMYGEDGVMAAFEPLGVKRKVFIHINNSNPAHLPRAPERITLESAGWDVARQGQKVTL
jgi:pyrroloquinoline quinone biosynthesis protein B